MNSWRRWVLLEHLGAPDDTNGIHYDLLLEEDLSCRAWRLLELPIVNGPNVKAIRLPAHNLRWLKIQSGPVSRNRGWAKRLFGGFFQGCLPDDYEPNISVLIRLEGRLGRLEIQNQLCRIFSIKQSETNT